MVSAIDRATRSLVALLQLGETLWRCAGADAARPCLFANFARLETGFGRFHFGSDRFETSSRFVET